MSVEFKSPCKVNLLLNILGRRSDGFHELETLMQPVAVYDQLSFEQAGSGVHLTCSEPSLAVDGSNLVHRAARAFLGAARISEGVRIHLIKRIPMAAGLGGGSANAAGTLRGLNQLFGEPLGPDQLNEIASTLGSDVPFFLQDGPAVGTGRGERIQPLDRFVALQGRAILLIRPGFGVSTPWAYRELANHPDALNGKPGRAIELAERLHQDDLDGASQLFFNSLEVPVFRKYPVLAVLKQELTDQGARATLMSGSGSTTFAIADSVSAAQSLEAYVLDRFGGSQWTAIAPL